jgi:hypothetical protein
VTVEIAKVVRLFRLSIFKKKTPYTPAVVTSRKGRENASYGRLIFLRPTLVGREIVVMFSPEC